MLRRQDEVGVEGGHVGRGWFLAEQHVQVVGRVGQVAPRFKGLLPIEAAVPVGNDRRHLRRHRHRLLHRGRPAIAVVAQGRHRRAQDAHHVHVFRQLVEDRLQVRGQEARFDHLLAERAQLVVGRQAPVPKQEGHVFVRILEGQLLRPMPAVNQVALLPVYEAELGVRHRNTFQSLVDGHVVRQPRPSHRRMLRPLYQAGRPAANHKSEFCLFPNNSINSLQIRTNAAYNEGATGNVVSAMTALRAQRHTYPFFRGMRPRASSVFFAFSPLPKERDAPMNSPVILDGDSLDVGDVAAVAHDARPVDNRHPD